MTFKEEVVNGYLADLRQEGEERLELAYTKVIACSSLIPGPSSS